MSVSLLRSTFTPPRCKKDYFWTTLGVLWEHFLPRAGNCHREHLPPDPGGTQTIRGGAASSMVHKRYDLCLGKDNRNDLFMRYQFQHFWASAKHIFFNNYKPSVKCAMHAFYRNCAPSGASAKCAFSRNSQSSAKCAMHAFYRNCAP